MKRSNARIQSNDPAWVDPENDDSIKDEIEPMLFGTGSLPHDDVVNEPEPDEVEEEEEEERPLQPTRSEPPCCYGSTTNDDDDSEDNYQDNRSRDAGPAAKTTSISAPQSSSTSPRPNEAKKKQMNKTYLLSLKPPVPQKHACMWMFHGLNGCAVVSALSIIVVQLIPFITSSFSQNWFVLLNLLLKCYIILFCILFILVEIDAPVAFIRNSQLFQAFFSRGFLYTFLGLISTVEAYSDRVGAILSGKASSIVIDEINWGSVLMQVSAWLMLAVGLIYMMLGVCCLKRVRDRMHNEDKEAWKKYRQDLKHYQRHIADQADLYV